mgnify:CR=1 FL=1
MRKLNIVAVLITCHNRKEKTLNCLNALYDSELKSNFSFEVFLVDDGSIDGTGEAVKLAYPDVNLINGDGSLYWNRGMFKAWEFASNKRKFDYYIWLNDDTMIFEHALELAFKESEKENNNSVIVGATCNENMTITTYGGWGKGKLLLINGKSQICEYFNGNFVLIPDYVFNKLGNLNYRYRHTNGDFDYAYRAREKGIKSVLLPDYVGTCERDKNTLVCFDPKVSLFKRIKLFYSPIGKNPFEFFYFNFRYKGILVAFRIFLSNHLRVLFPSFFLKKY